MVARCRWEVCSLRHRGKRGDLSERTILGVRTGLVGERNVIAFFGLAVASARSVLKRAHTHNFHGTATIVDESAIAQRGCGVCDAGSAYRKHVREKLMSDEKRIGMATVADGEQPAGQSGFKFVKVRARRCLRKLAHENVSVAVQRLSHECIGGELPF